MPCVTCPYPADLVNISLRTYDCMINSTCRSVDMTDGFENEGSGSNTRFKGTSYPGLGSVRLEDKLVPLYQSLSMHIKGRGVDVVTSH